MLSVDQARQQLLAAASCSLGQQQLPLDQACGRVLANDVMASQSVPPFANSAMDGFAVRVAEIKPGKPYQIGQTVLAGMAPAPLATTTVARIFTGAMLPPGADAVLAQEDCDYDDKQMTPRQIPSVARHIRQAGEDIAAGQCLLTAGRRLSAVDVGLLASCGVVAIAVRHRLRIGLLATGSELQNPGKPLLPGQIYNSNLPMLAALLQGRGFQVQSRHEVDDLQSLEQAFAALAANNDVLLSIGGVSVGDADLVRQVIERHGQLALWKVAMKPGKPLAFGHVFGKPVIGLPGNPVSAFVGMQVFVQDFLALMQGELLADAPLLYYPLRLQQPLTAAREQFLRVRLVDENDMLQLLVYPQQGSGVLSSVAWASGLARLPAAHLINDGDFVQYLPFG